MRKILFFLFCCFFAIPHLAYGAETIRLLIKISDKVVEGFLEENSVTSQLLAMSPIQIEMKDYNGHERIGYPPEKLSLKGVQKGFMPKQGDLALFAPWGNLCVYVKDSPFSADLIYLGRINKGMDIMLSHKDPFMSQWLISESNSKNRQE